MAELKQVFKKAYQCSEYSDFVNYSDFTDCISDLKELQRLVPESYPHYSEVQNAVEFSIKRIELQKEIKYSQYKNESQFIQARSVHRMYRDREKQAWNNLEVARVEYQNQKESTVFSDNFNNILILLFLFLAIFTYRMIVSNKIGKIKAQKLLKIFELNELMGLVEKDLGYKIKFKTSWFGLKIQEQVEEIQLSDEEVIKLNLIYKNLYILEEAYHEDIRKNKINALRGVNLDSEDVQRARSHFLNRIDEKVI